MDADEIYNNMQERNSIFFDYIGKDYKAIYVKCTETISFKNTSGSIKLSLISSYSINLIFDHESSNKRIIATFDINAKWGSSSPTTQSLMIVFSDKTIEIWQSQKEYSSGKTNQTKKIIAEGKIDVYNPGSNYCLKLSLRQKAWNTKGHSAYE